MTHKAIAIRQVPFENLGAFAPELEARNFTIEYVDAGIDAIRSQPVRSADVLFVPGGPIDANDDHLYPFLADELHIIDECLVQGRPLVGICLGAQLMARSLGANVYLRQQKRLVSLRFN